MRESVYAPKRVEDNTQKKLETLELQKMSNQSDSIPNQQQKEIKNDHHPEQYQEEEELKQDFAKSKKTT